MGKASSGSGMDGSTTYDTNTVFIDTSLDTHLVMVVSDVDTVSDFKKKIAFEHSSCFPNLGEIKIHALKVKRKGHFYHLSDYMLVKSAFDGVKTSWLLHVDASSLAKHSESTLLTSNLDNSNPLFCIIHPLSDGVDNLPDGASKKLAIVDGSLRPFGSDHFLNQRILNAVQFGPDASIREVLKDLEMEVNHMSDDQCKTSSSDTSKRLDSRIQEKFNLDGKGNEMLERLAKCNEDRCQNATSNVQCNSPLEGNIKSAAVTRKKHKAKKKIESLVDTSFLKINDASIDASRKDTLEQEITVPQNLSDNAHKGALNDMEMGNKHISDKHGKVPVVDISMKVDSGMQKTNDSREKTQVTEINAESNNDKLKEKVVDVQPNISPGEASEDDQVAKKKRKIEKKSNAQDPLKEKEALICNTSENISKPENMVFGNTMDDKLKSTTATYDSLSTAPQQDIHLISNKSDGGKKKKRKRKASSSYNDVVAAVPFPVEDVREVSSKGRLGISQRGSREEADAAITPVQTSQDAMHSEPCSISLREKYCDTVQEVGGVHKASLQQTHSRNFADVHAGGLVAIGTIGIDAGSVRSTVDAIDVAIEKQIGSSQNNDCKVLLPEMSKPSGQGETEVSMKEVIASSNLLDDNGGMAEPGKSAHKAKKRKKIKKTVGGMQVTSGTEHASGSVTDLPSTELHKTGHKAPSHDINTSEVDAASVRCEGNAIDLENGKERKSSQNNDPQVLLPEISKPSDLGETEVSVKDVVVSSKLLDDNGGVVEPGKSAGKEKKQKKTKKTVGGMQVTLGTEHASGSVTGPPSTEPHKTGHKAPSHDINTSEVDAASVRHEGDAIDLANGKERKSSQNNDPQVLLPEITKPSDLGETEVNMKEVVVSSKLLDDNGVVEPEKSAGGGRKQKKTKNTVGEMQVTLDIKHASGFSTEPHKTLNGDHSDDEANRDKNFPSHTVGLEVAETETVNTSNLRAAEDAHEVHGRVVESSQRMQTRQTQEIPVNQNKKGRKKSKKKQISAAEILPDVQMKEQDVGSKTSTPSNDKVREPDAPSRMTEKIKLVETSYINQINGSNLQPEKNTGRKAESLHTQADDAVDSIMSGRTDEANRKMEVSLSQGDKINFSEYFLPSQHQHEVVAEVSGDEVNKVKKSEKKMKAKKKQEKADIHSLGTSLDLLDQLKSNQNQGSETESRVDNSNTIQELLTEDKSDKFPPHSKSSKTFENKVEVRRSNEVDKLNPTREVASRPKVVKVSKTRVPALPNLKGNAKANAALSSSSERSTDKHRSGIMTARKRSNDNLGEILNSSRHGKSLLAGNIFNNGNGESSEDDGVVDSDSSTRTPSDDSSSSDYSEVEQKSGMITPETGSAKRKTDGGKNNLKSFSSGMKNVTLDTILRSSSRYKKAKLTASQSQLEDTESQPVEFVPDGQA